MIEGCIFSNTAYLNNNHDTKSSISVLGFQVAAKSMKMDWAIKKFSYHQLSKKKRMSCLKPGWHLNHVAKFNSVEDAGCLMYKKQYPTSWTSLLFFSFPLLFLVQKSCWLKSISTDFLCFCYYLFYHQCRLEAEVIKTQKWQSTFTDFILNIELNIPLMANANAWNAFYNSHLWKAKNLYIRSSEGQLLI